MQKARFRGFFPLYHLLPGGVGRGALGRVVGLAVAVDAEVAGGGEVGRGAGDAALEARVDVRGGLDGREAELGLGRTAPEDVHGRDAAGAVGEEEDALPREALVRGGDKAQEAREDARGVGVADVLGDHRRRRDLGVVVRRGRLAQRPVEAPV